MTHAAKHWVPLFPREEIPAILKAVLRCSATLKKKTSYDTENPITLRLFHHLQRDSALRKRPIHPELEPSIVTGGLTPKVSGRPDIWFLFSTGIRKPWPYFAIEAKRLHVTYSTGKRESLVTDYVTDQKGKNVQGMMCFVSQRYSRGLVSGAMLGYVLDGNITAACVSIAAEIVSQRKLLRAKTPKGLKKSKIVPGSNIHLSHHKLPKLTKVFTIYHVLIPL